ncbi:MAG: hypothetical protein CM1200mP29_04140 [Verrucomicrobiota bacterium]|nr:MAG: hypothetical protein CM1200mP29_04140 [Verrucomicrobiota bacterium]
MPSACTYRLRQGDGRVRDGALNVVFFFGLTVVLTSLLVWFYAQSFWFAALPLGCSISAVAWQLGLLNLLGYGIDPMSILVPFLVFAIGVSHGVQMVRAFRAELFAGCDSLEAGRRAFRQLLVPGSVALITDTIGFVTILLIPVPTIRELAIAASIGVAAIILTNLLLLPCCCHTRNPATVSARAWLGGRCGRVKSGTRLRTCRGQRWRLRWLPSARFCLRLVSRRLSGWRSATRTRACRSCGRTHATISTAR